MAFHPRCQAEVESFKPLSQYRTCILPCQPPIASKAKGRRKNVEKYGIQQAIRQTTCAVEHHFLTKTCLLRSPLQSYEKT